MKRGISALSEGPTQNHFLQLPKELILHILNFLDIKSIARLSVSKFLQKLTDDDQVWMNIANNLKLTFSPSQIKKQVEVSDYPRDIIEAFGGLHVLASFPKVENDQKDKATLKSLDKIVVRGKNNQTPFIKILKKSRIEEGCIDNEILYSNLNNHPRLLFMANILNNGNPVYPYCFSKEVYEYGGHSCATFHGDNRMLQTFAKEVKEVYEANEKAKI